jgi:hypothetical protein
MKIEMRRAKETVDMRIKTESTDADTMIEIMPGLQETADEIMTVVDASKSLKLSKHQSDIEIRRLRVKVRVERSVKDVVK